MLLVGLVFAGLGTAIGSSLKDMQGFQLIMNFLVLPIFFLSGALYPLSNLPAALAAVTRVDPLTYGCLFGGSIEYTAYRNGYKAALDDCALTDRLPLTGDATIDTTRGTFALRVTGPSATSLAYGRDAKGRTSVTGTWFGEPASLAGQVAASARQHD